MHYYACGFQKEMKKKYEKKKFLDNIVLKASSVNFEVHTS